MARHTRFPLPLLPSGPGGVRSALLTDHRLHSANWRVKSPPQPDFFNMQFLTPMETDKPEAATLT